MRHVVNFGLLFSFITLAVTGVLSFVLPFDLPTTRIHIVFGLVTLILVGLHLYSRVPYFKQQLGSKSGASVSPRVVLFITFIWGLLLAGSIKNWAPVSVVIEQGYEARHRDEIVRPDPLVASIRNGTELVSGRQQKDTDTVALSVHALLNAAIEGDVAIALWAESTAGTLIETLYVSPGMAFSDNPSWGGKTVSRADVLPIWRNRYTALTGLEPDGTVDGISGATADHKFSLNTYLAPGADDFVICLELNVVGDTNAAWSDSVLGQPSVLYTGLAAPDEEPAYVLLELTGHGGKGDHAGAIQYDLKTIDTAKRILEIGVVRTVRTGDGDGVTSDR